MFPFLEIAAGNGKTSLFFWLNYGISIIINIIINLESLYPSIFFKGVKHVFPLLDQDRGRGEKSLFFGEVMEEVFALISSFAFFS